MNKFICFKHSYQFLFTSLAWLSFCYSSLVFSQNTAPELVEKIVASQMGTGFSVSKNGYILTANHVVQDADFIIVFASGELKGLRAKLIKTDKSLDLALIHVNKITKPIALINWKSVPNGLEIFALGYPNPSMQGRELKITSGLVNSLEGLPNKVGLFQFSAPIQHGNSGGPVIGPDLGVIGLVNGKLDSKSNPKVAETLQNVNFAIRSNELDKFLKEANIQFISQDLDLNKAKKSHEIFSETQASIYTIVAARNPNSKNKPQPSSDFLDLFNRLSSNQKPKLNGAFKIGFDKLLELGAEQILLKTESINIEKGTSHIRSFDFIISLNSPKKHNEKSYLSTINSAKFNCIDSAFMMVRQEFKDSTFGTGITLESVKRKADVPDVFQKLRSPVLNDYFYSHLCRYVANVDLFSDFKRSE